MTSYIFHKLESIFFNFLTVTLSNSLPSVTLQPTLYNKWNVIVHITVGDKQFKCRMYLFLNIKCTSCENATIHV